MNALTADQRFALRLFVVTFTVQNRRAPTFTEAAEARGLPLPLVTRELKRGTIRLRAVS